MSKGRIAALTLAVTLGGLLVPEVGSAAAAGAATTLRDPFVRPFAPDSIWNMPIGSDARYVPTGYPVMSHNGIDRAILAVADASDPVRQVLQPYKWNDRCNAASTKVTGSLQVPDDLVVADAVTGSTPNNNGGVLQPDGRTFADLGVLCRDQAGGPVYGWAGTTSDLVDGDGRRGSHGASWMSAIGGAIRPGELTGDAPIQHTLDLVLDARYAFIANGDTSTCYVWPAYRCDAYAASTYAGTNPAFRIGSLLAIPPGVTPADLGVTTTAGRKLFAALQDHGGYFTDDSGWDANYLVIDRDASNDIAAYDSEVRAEFARMVAAAQVVTNNTPTSIGGGGTPRVPMLEPAATSAGTSSSTTSTTAVTTTTTTTTTTAPTSTTTTKWKGNGRKTRTRA